MAAGRLGPFTAALEAAATVVGAGILVGGFVIGLVLFLAGRSRAEIAARALTDGFAGGIVGVGFILLDLALRYLR